VGHPCAVTGATAPEWPSGPTGPAWHDTPPATVCGTGSSSSSAPGPCPISVVLDPGTATWHGGSTMEELIAPDQPCPGCGGARQGRPLLLPDTLAVFSAVFADPARAEPDAVHQPDHAMDGLRFMSDPVRITRIAAAGAYLDRIRFAREALSRAVAEAARWCPGQGDRGAVPPCE
jgi:hypothetical protein